MEFFQQYCVWGTDEIYAPGTLGGPELILSRVPVHGTYLEEAVWNNAE